MADLAAIRQALATALDVIPNLRCYPQLQAQINPPAAVIGAQPGGLISRDTFGDAVTLQLRATIFVQYAEDASSQAALDAYLATSGPSSVWATLKANPRLSGVVDDCTVTGVRYLPLQTVAGQQYLAADVLVSVMAS